MPQTLWLDGYNDIHAINFKSLWNIISRNEAGKWQIANFASVFEVNVTMVADVGVEEGFAKTDRETPQQSDFNEEIQDIVYCRERRKYSRFVRLDDENIGGEVKVLTAEE